jgi:hypothetical protein
MLTRRQTAVIALFACLVVGIGWFDRVSSQHPPQDPSVSAVKQNANTNADQRQPTKSLRQRFTTIWNRTWDDPVAFYTFVLSIFTGLLAVVSAFQIFFLIRADKTARLSAEAAQTAAKSAMEGNQLTREIFVAEQRPWLLWRLPAAAHIIKIGHQLNIRIDGEVENIGNTPALNVTYFGKLYTPTKNEAMMNQGISFYSENLHQALSYQFSLANVLPTEKVPISFSPHGIEIASLPSDQEFVLCLAFHAKYEFLGPLKRVAEIGAVYMVRPIKADRVTFQIGEFGASTPVVLVEYPGVRRIT